MFQAAPLMFDPTQTTLIIMPLKALKDQQCNEIQNIKDCKPFVLNRDTNNAHNLKFVQSNQFTHDMSVHINKLKESVLI